jgi:hypothetical protein
MHSPRRAGRGWDLHFYGQAEQQAGSVREGVLRDEGAVVEQLRLLNSVDTECNTPPLLEQ